MHVGPRGWRGHSVPQAWGEAPQCWTLEQKNQVRGGEVTHTFTQLFDSATQQTLIKHMSWSKTKPLVPWQRCGSDIAWGDGCEGLWMML